MRFPRSIVFILAASFWAVASGGAVADVRAVLACRQLPPGPARAACLERASAELERQSAPSPGKPASATRLGDRIRAGVESITYQAGKPVFRLDNGQVWYSTDRRRLTFKPGRSHVSIEKTPVGMLLHYNGSFFALQVVAETS